MKLTLTPEQAAYLRSQPATEATKVPLALRLIGVTRAQFATALGMSPQWASYVLSGTNITLATAQRIAGAFGVGVDDLFPMPPSTAKADRRTPRKLSKPRATGKLRGSRGPKAQVAA